jgi:hypothetical protein
LGARDIEVEFVSFGRSLPQMLDATSTSKSTKAHKVDYVKITPLQSERVRRAQPEKVDVMETRRLVVVLQG